MVNNLPAPEEGLFTHLAFTCSKQEMCSPDVRKKILAAGADEETAGKIIARLKEENYLDDERFVKSYVGCKFRINGWGRVKIRYYLRLKGLKNELIELGLNDIGEEEYVQKLRKTLREKAGKIRKKEKYEKMGQLIRYAQGRGFEPEWIHRYLGEVVT